MSLITDEAFVATLLRFLHTQAALIGLPGAGLAIVREGETIYTGGIGVLEAGSARSVDDNSLFAIASCSKAFTTTLCARLAEKGKLSWDQPIRDWWQNFNFGTEAMSAQVTLRDLCANRTGITQAAAVEYGSSLAFDAVVNGAGGLPVVAPFRDRYSYSNLHFTIAAAVCTLCNGKDFAKALKDDVFRPLGMLDASTDRRDLESNQRFARPHVRNGNTMQPIKLINLENLIGAGSVTLSPNDAALWLKFNLGTHPERISVLSDAGRAELTRFQIRTRVEDNFLGYGLGWRIGTNNNSAVVDHTGSIGGAISLMRLVPKRRFGLFISCNASGPEITDLRNAVVDLAVELDGCEEQQALSLCEKAAQALALKHNDYRKSVWQGAQFATLDALEIGEFDGGPMGWLRIIQDAQGLAMTLDLLPEYQYRIMSPDADGNFPLRSIASPDHWWGINDLLPVLSFSDDNNVMAWKHMWFGDCSFRRI